MSNQLLPDFDGPGSQPDEARPGPKKPRRKPAKKKAVRASSLKVAKRVPKKRRVRKAAVSLKVGPVPRLSVMFQACTVISEALKYLSPKEREAVLESVTAGL